MLEKKRWMRPEENCRVNQYRVHVKIMWSSCLVRRCNMFWSISAGDLEINENAKESATCAQSRYNYLTAWMLLWEKGFCLYLDEENPLQQPARENKD